MSPLTQGRGLKQLIGDYDKWALQSPLTQGRGLKRVSRDSIIVSLLSPLTQGRGLKHLLPLIYSFILHVAPHAGAWIETSVTFIGSWSNICRPSRRGVDWNGLICTKSSILKGRPSRRGVDWNNWQCKSCITNGKRIGVKSLFLQPPWLLFFSCTPQNYQHARGCLLLWVLSWYRFS